MVKELKRQSDKQLLEDIKKYIRYSHDFYTSKVPELKTLGKRLHQEYSLKEFYKVFNKLWYSNKHNEISLAIYTLQLYRDDFDFATWKFIKNKIREIKSWDQIDSIGSEIIGYILLKNSRISKEIIKLSKSKKPWYVRLSLMSMAPLIEKGNMHLAMNLIDLNLYSKNEHVQKAVGTIIKKISEVKPEFAKRFILKHMNMPNITFLAATENLKDLRRIRNLKKLNTRGFGKLMFWKGI